MKHCDYKGYSFWCGDVGMMTPKQYMKMIDLLEESKPKRICEFGSGQSTEIFETYIKKSNAQLYSIENDKYYMTHKNNLLTPLENTAYNNYENCVIYKGLEDWLKQQDKFDFILIDGPNDVLPENKFGIQYSRIQILSFILLNKLNDKAIIIYHDSNVEEAKNTLEEFEKLLKNYNKEIIIETDNKIVDKNINILKMCPELTIYKLW